MMKKTYLIIFTLCLLASNSFAQIPAGYYDGTEDLYGEELKAVLHDIIDGHDEPTYNDLRDFILKESDEDPQNANNIILLYTGRSQAKSTFGGGINEWNREHTWAKSHGDFGNNPPCGTDAHMIRPTDASVNSDRGNKDFDEGGQQHPEATGCYYTEYTWEPRDEVKGDVARIILYMDVRYEGDNGELDLTAVDAVNTSPAPEHGRLSILLEWHEQDPPDDFELNRNNVVYSYQDNRNPFIDHPEFVYEIWGESAQIDDAHGNQEVNLYPNPVVDNLHVSSDYSSLQLMQVYNSIGEHVSSHQLKAGEEFIIDCNNLPSGLYFIRFTDEQSRQAYVSSFIKND
jgi:endonuclease I